MRRTFVAAVLLVAAQAGAADAPGVVGIYTTSGNVGGQGTGFLISTSGEIATAYHVIHGAQRIDVTWRGNKFSDVVIVRTYPEVDVAVLRIPFVPSGLTPLPVAAKHNSWAAGDTVQVFGYSRGVADQRYDGSVTQSGAWLSEQIRDDQQRRLFRVVGLELVPLDVTIYSGISGGPVLRGGEVIGILSGSLSQGRGIAWGIPVGYLPMAKKVERRASQMQVWPDFAMTKDWSTMRSRFRIDSAASRLIDEYFASIDQLAAAHDAVRTADRKTWSSVQWMRRQSENAATKSSSASPDLLHGGIAEKLFLQSLNATGKAHNHSVEIESKLLNVWGKIISYMDERYSGLPRTARNFQAVVDAEASGKQMRERHARMPKAHLSSELLALGPAIQKLSEVDVNDKQKSAAAMMDILEKVDALMAQEIGIQQGLERNGSLRRYREIGEYMQSIFSYPQDLTSEPKTYVSPRHAYTVTFPRGWVEYSSELAKHIPFTQEVSVDLHFVRTGFFDDKRRASEMPTLITRGGLGPASPVTDQLVASVLAKWEARNRSIATGLRNVTAIRTSFGENPAILIQAVFDKGKGRGWAHDAFVLDPGGMLGVFCTYYIRTDIDECKTITASVRFK